MIKITFLSILLSSLIYLTACKTIKGSGSGSDYGIDKSGSLKGVNYGGKYRPFKPNDMVYIPQGTFHMGPSDEDVSYTLSARNRQISISGFWMDRTEITNSEYKAFVLWVRDSIIAEGLQLKDAKTNANDPKKITALWKDKNLNEKISQFLISPEDRIRGKAEIDVEKLIYIAETFDLRAAAYRKEGESRSKFIIKDTVKVYPDTLVWVRDFAYAHNDPMTTRYFSHPSYMHYPVVGVNWKQASAFCIWRTAYTNSILTKQKRSEESDFRLPTDAEWEYAARGGRSQAMYPWGGPYTRNKKGCLLANFKPGRGNYPEDGGFYTVRADAYWPNDYGLYNMAGNVAEWTSSLYELSADYYTHDENPDLRYNAKKDDPPLMKRKVIRGGSWKDVAFFIQNGTRAYEYQDSAKSYIGFRCVIDLSPPANRR